jgi:hypothetical protein
VGLDVYVGSLTRYYVEGPLAVAERIARHQGIPFEPGSVATVDGPADEELIRAAILTWREGLGRWLGDRLHGPLVWDESRAAPCLTDKPGWDGYGCTLLLAAHEEHPDLPDPAGVSFDWPDDPAYQASLAAGPASRYEQLFGPELWLPCRFAFTVRTQDVTGLTVEIGSSVALLAQLQALRDRHRLDGTPDGGPPTPLAAAARPGFGHLLRLAERSVADRLPMKLDF